MAKPRWRHPSVFVACPYRPAKTYDAFRVALDRVPLEFHYAESAIRTKYVLDRIRHGIRRTDFSLFDITGWNPNVTLELGLAAGLDKNYYILFKPGRGARKDPPSDLKGLQRFEYKTVDGFEKHCLEYKLDYHLVRELPLPRELYDELSGRRRDKTFIVAMRILAHFKKHKLLQRTDLDSLSRGSRLRREEKNSLLRLMRSRRLILGDPEGNRWRRGRTLYRNLRL